MEIFPFVQLLKKAKEFNNNANNGDYIIGYVFSEALEILCCSTKISHNKINKLKKLKGAMESTDILIDAIVDGKIPDDTFNNDLLVTSAIILSKKIIASRSLSKKHYPDNKHSLNPQ